MSDYTNGRPNPIKFDFSSHSDSMVIAFGSLRLKPEPPPFEWTGVLGSLPAKKIFIRDLHRFWYLKGLPGIADSPEGVGRYLRHVIGEQGSRRVVTFGGSMGGYAALLFGHLLQADTAIAFAPQTFLPSRKAQIVARSVRRRKWRILWKYWRLVSNREVNRKFFNLRPLLKNGNQQTTYHLFFSCNNEKDLLQARHVEALRNVQLHERADAGHHVANAMKNSGELEQVLLKAICLQ